ncbi:uncharacterized mitochondrial protein AtMg00810-like [Rosa rugosa]|uniref:uncharacterized mitochondrial protein AtMg00810-like n=1 Tax=Rosa rugosa TaxID=74645 RepID=UPI002B407535|nr:uncharacterized mitochondrial protein AtMg00810-like [Rosa rugosa]
MDTMRMILALATQRSWIVYQLDVNSAFLQAELTEDVFMEQPRGYVKKEDPHKVYKLKKALYGLKHDDLIYIGDNVMMIEEFKNSMMREFKMSDLGKMKYFLKIEVLQLSDGIFIGQKKYAMDVLKRFGIEGSNAVLNPIVGMHIPPRNKYRKHKTRIANTELDQTPHETAETPIVPRFKISRDKNGVEVDATFYKHVVGSLMYLTATRPDLMYAVSLISRYMSQPTELHLMAAKRVLRYVKGTVNFGIFYKKEGNKDLAAFTDSDYAGCLEDRKSTSGYAFILNSRAVAWSLRKQPIVTLSTTENESIAAAACACQVVWMKIILKKLSYEGGECTTILWMKIILKKLSYEGGECTTIFYDNSSTIKLSRNPVMHGRSKHIDVRFNFLRDLTKEGVVQLVLCGTQEQVADVFTKPLKLDLFLKLRGLLGVCETPEAN